MKNFIRMLFFTAALCSSLFYINANAMEDRPRPSREKTGKRNVSSQISNLLRNKAPNTFTEESPPVVVSQDASKLNPQSEYPLDIDYKAEHERVSRFIEKIYREKNSLYLPGHSIFSLPNTASIMQKLANCNYIDLNDNLINALPDEINEWSALTSLDLSSNKLSVAPWQVFTIGKCVGPAKLFTIYLNQNPIKRIPDVFYEAMMHQKNNRKICQYFSIILDDEVIKAFIIPKLQSWPELKAFLVDSSREKITNGHCKIQNEDGKFLTFNADDLPLLSYEH